MTTSPWLPVTREHPDVVGIDPDDDSRLEVQIGLSTVPPVEWAERFANPVDGGSDSATPTLKGKTVTIRPPDAELAAAVADVDRRIEGANTYFAAEVLPEVDAALAEQREQEDEATGDRGEEGRVRAARLQAQTL
ncbi:hypothetical protein HC251_16550 [Iamia sp. SCSIO 61187]|uniref:hypothetical protein n=1 Tax=Iamia sp. SCSIO 61187 TaxID=2722752 RepID=UPI001C6308DE|nr:hypothetical protein [Iamia sp. SCSIO 61187]QYG93881.1 hypothetical protein HC251_16550 [Iamia sp. SCSIO 61187]